MKIRKLWGKPRITPVGDDVPMPNIVDQDGHLLDPTSLMGMPQPLAEGQEAPGSIFHVPPAPGSDSRICYTSRAPGRDFRAQEESLAALLAQLRRQGFQGNNMIVNSWTTPEDFESFNQKRQAYKQALPHARRNYRVANGQPPLCPYCKAVLENQEDREGFDLQELYEVAKSGCETCDVLHQAITYFAKFVFSDFDMNRVWVKQSQNGPSRLLSETRMVEVRFEEHQDEILTLSFKAAGRQNQRATFRASLS